MTYILKIYISYYYCFYLPDIFILFNKYQKLIMLLLELILIFYYK